MLTFFEYLRQRAFDSIMAGAQEAMDALESQSGDTQSKTSTVATKQSQRQIGSSKRPEPAESSASAESKHSPDDSGKVSEVVEQPRQRPKQKQARKGTR